MNRTKRPQAVLMCAVGVLLAVSDALAVNNFTKKGSNSWFVADNWSSRSVPSASEEVTIPGDAGVVTLDGGEAQSSRIRVLAENGVTNNADGFVGTVVIKGPGTLHKDAQVIPGWGRRLVFDGVNRPDGISYMMPYGELVLRNGCDWRTDGSSGSFYTYGEDSRLVIDGSALHALALSCDSSAKPGVIRIVNGGVFEYINDYSSKFNYKVELIDGTYVAHKAQKDPFFLTSAFPRRPGGALVVRGDTEVNSLCPTLAAGDLVRFDGSVYVTNYVAQGSVFTNSATFYGRGCLYTGGFRLWSGLNSTPAKLPDVTFAIGAIYNRGTYGVRYADYACTFRYPQDITLGAIGNWAASGGGKTTNIVEGVITFDTRNPFTGEKHSIEFCGSTMEAFREGAGVAAVGGGTVTFNCGSANVGKIHVAAPSKFTEVTVGEETTMNAKGLTFSADLRTAGLTIGDNATLRLMPDESSSSHVSAVGEVTVGENATVALKQKFPPENNGHSNNPLFLSVEDFDGDINFTLYNGSTAQQLSDGWGICRVGGCYLLTNGTTSASGYATGKTWRGTTDGSWARTSNWQNQPGTGDYARFLGWPAAWNMKTSVITNDVEGGLTLAGFDVQRSAGPYIVRGDDINIVSNDAVVSHSIFPQIFEAKFVSDREDLLLKSMSDTRDLGAIALKGGLCAPAAALTVSGEIVLGGEVSVKDLILADIDRSVAFGWDKTSRGGQLVRNTALNIRAGANVKVLDQTTAQTINGSLWVGTNALLDVTGDWLWNATACVHRVDGTLKVSGSLGGDVRQTYWGMGTVRAGAVADPIRIGRGLTLDPAAVSARVEVDAAATLAPSVSLEVSESGGFDVGPGVIFTLAPAEGAELTMSSPIAGSDYDLVVGGKGTTVLASDGNAGLDYLTVKAGATLELQADYAAQKLETESGSTLLIGLTDEGKVPMLTLDQGVDLTGVTFAMADESVEDALAGCGWQPVLRVAALNAIEGVPAEGVRFGRLRLKVVEEADGSLTLAAKADRGCLLIIR